MPTNLRQPWDQGFDSVLIDWWTGFNDVLPTELTLAQGSHQPLTDWVVQADLDCVWYYPLDDWDIEELVLRANTAIELPRFLAIGVNTALSVTAGLSDDLLHDVEIPGIWLIRVQKT